MATRTIEARQRMSKAQLANGLTAKQARFVKAYAKHANGTRAAREAGYDQSDAALGVQAYDNLRKPKIIAAIEQETQRIDYTADRVKRRLDRLSHGAEAAQQYGVSVRAEELIGKAAGMWVDQSINITANLSGDHLQALLSVAQNRATQPLELEDTSKATERKTLLDD